MSYNIRWHGQESRRLRQLPRRIIEQVLREVGDLRIDPRPHRAEKLSGFEQVWRIRVGQYRVLYQIVEAQQVIYIVRVVKRSEAYERTDDLRRRLMAE